MIELLHEFPAVQHAGKRLYGGDQSFSQDKTVRSCGCGVIAALDLLIYLCRYHGCRIPRLETLVRSDPIPSSEYDRCVLDLKRRYFPLIPGHGINGLSLAFGVNRLFRRFELPYRAHWGVFGTGFWFEIERMLRCDLPVILSVGPNFPLFWQHNALPFYIKRPNERFSPATRAHAHYVSVTGIDEQWLRISSWGREYYISRSEYEAYVKKHSLQLVSNILCLKKR